MRADDPVAVIDDAGRPGQTRLVLTGRVTVADADQLLKLSREAAARGADVTVCYAGVEHLDAAAVQVLVCLGRDLSRRRLRCGATGASEAVAEALRLGGLVGD